MNIDKSIRRDTRTTITLKEDEYKAILRRAVEAPADAEVEVEDTYGGPVRISWTETTYDEGSAT